MREYFKSKGFTLNKSKRKSKPKTHKEALAKYAGKNVKPRIINPASLELAALKNRGRKISKAAGKITEDIGSSYLLSDKELGELDYE